MPDERPMKHRQKSGLNDYDQDRRKKRHKRHKYSCDEELEVLKHNSKRNDSSEVIEIHGSSSEEGEISNDEGCDGSNSPKVSHKHRHKHSRHYAKKHKRNHSGERHVDEEKDAVKSHKSDSKKKHSSKDEHRSNYASQKSRRLRDNEVEVKKESDSADDLREPRIKSKVEVRPLSNHSKREESSEDRDREEDHSRRRNESSRNKNRRDDRDNTRVSSIKEENGRDNERRSNSSSGRNNQHRKRDDPDEYEWGKNKNSEPSVKGEPVDKAKPDFKLSGKLTEDRNTYNGVVIKYSEPPESRMPKKRWRLYQFKGQETLPTLYIHRQSAYLIGRDRKVVDLPVDHPSCSKQHAALQYRLVTFERLNGTTGKQIRLYVIDLESANGTFINGSKIETKKYVELMEKDVIKFGFSSREYVLLHEQSKDDELSDDG